MANDDELDPRRNQWRRGAEHVRIKGTTEELGGIIPTQVVTEEDEERRDARPADEESDD